MDVTTTPPGSGTELLRRVHKVYEDAGPFSTVHVEVGRVTADAAQAIRLRWRALLASAQEQGAPARHLETLRGLVEDEPGLGGQVWRTVVVGSGGLVLDERIQGSGDTADWAVHGPVPHLLPLLADASSWVPYVEVAAARDRASVALRVAGRAGGVEQEVQGETEHMRKVRAGGWANRRYQQHAEEVWNGNADLVADEVVRVATESGAELVVVAGDVRARQALEASLDGRIRVELVDVDAHTLPAGASGEALSEALGEALTVRRRHHLEALLDRVAGGLAHEAAATGVPGVVAAAQQARVETLLLAPGELAGRRLMALAAPPWVGEESDDLPVERLGEVDAVDALVRTAVLTDAGIVVLDGPRPELSEGVAAVLRWSGPSEQEVTGEPTARQ